MNDRSCADKADTRNNLRRDARVISRELAGQLCRENRKHRRAKADEQVRAQAGRAMPQLALQSDCAAQNGGQEQPHHAIRNERARAAQLPDVF